MIELGRFKELQSLTARDLDAFSGYALERYFFWKFREDTFYTNMGGWQDRKGENEIDLVCEDSINGRLDFYEVKRDVRRIDLAARNGNTGIGKPEPLRNFEGCWSRRIDQENRLVYKLIGEGEARELVIFQCATHYE